MSGAALLLSIAGAVEVRAAEPAKLSFAVGDDVVEVAGSQFTEVSVASEGILRFCLDAPTEERLSAFTSRHVGELVDVAVDGEVVFRPTIGTPYNSGCISWPVGAARSPVLRDRLLGRSADE